MSPSDRSPSTSPGAAESDIASCEAAVGAGLPEWLRTRLAQVNGFEVDDTMGRTGQRWTFLPVVDRSDQRRRKRTAADIAHHSRRLRAAARAGTTRESALANVVVVAHAYAESTRLVLLPNGDQLGPDLRRQDALGFVRPELIEFAALGRRPTPPPTARLRARSALPPFRYHPDPVATGSIVADVTTVCPSCVEVTGWRYSTTPYGPGDQPNDLCPWCIADGSAARRFGAEFISDLEVDDASADLLDEIVRRTPGYLSWQGERWLSCCGDAAEFLGPVGWADLEPLADAQQCLLDDGWPVQTLPLIRADGDLTAYLFRCRHCGRHLAAADSS